MTRIIGGLAGGARLVTAAGGTTRPTSDRVREGIFSRLDHLDVLDGSAVVDLYAGSGALGLEAASRGAARVLLVDRHLKAVDAARQNAIRVRAAGVSAEVLVRAEPVQRVLAAPVTHTYDVAFLDPPYDLAEHVLAADLMALVPWLANDAVVVVERASRSPEPHWPAGIRLQTDKRYGETRIWYALREAADR